MNTDLETPPLEGIIWEGTPPCDCQLFPDWRICGRPSAVRITSRCDSCAKPVFGWACAPCWKVLRPYVMFQDFTCVFCGGHREVRET